MRDFVKNPLGKNERIKYDDLYELYINQNKSVKQITQIINRSQPAIEKTLQSYGIKKPKDLVGSSRSAGLSCRTKEDWGRQQEKTKQTCQERYGCDYPLQNAEVKAKCQATCQKKYGSVCALGNKGKRQQAKQTCLKKYGVDTYSKTLECKERVKQTNIKRYGDDYGKQLYQRSLTTIKQKYGDDVTCSLQLPYVKEKVQKHWQQLGRSGSNQNYSDETYKILSSKENLTTYIENEKSQNAYYLAEQLGITTRTLYLYVHKYDIFDKLQHNDSSYEQEIKNILTTWGIKCEKRTDLIYPYELDIYCEDYNFAVEFNGSYLHSELFKDKNYHTLKSQLAQEKGIFLFHIFEYEWRDERKRLIILSQLKNLLKKNTERIFARNCKIQSVSSKESAEFLENNHLQGKDASSVRLGLYKDGKLVSLMTFCKPRFSNKTDWELSRFCNRCDTSVVGGASKLFKYFRDNYKGSIISYSNIAKTKGRLYEKLGFMLNSVTTPNYVWYNLDSRIVKSRYQCQMKNEKNFMQSLGFERIFDCGNKVWIID